MIVFFFSLSHTISIAFVLSYLLLLLLLRFFFLAVRRCLPLQRHRRTPSFSLSRRRRRRRRKGEHRKEKNKEEELSPTDAVCFRRRLSRFLSHSLRKASSFSVFRVGVMKNLLLAAKHEIRTNTRTRAHLFEKGNR